MTDIIAATENTKPSLLCNPQLVDPFKIHFKDPSVIIALRATCKMWHQALDRFPSLTISPECYCFDENNGQTTIDPRFREFCRTTERFIVDVRTARLDIILRQVVSWLPSHTRVKIRFYDGFCGGADKTGRGTCAHATSVAYAMVLLAMHFPRFQIAPIFHHYTHRCNDGVRTREDNSTSWLLFEDAIDAIPWADLSIEMKGRFSSSAIDRRPLEYLVETQPYMRSLVLRDTFALVFAGTERLLVPIDSDMFFGLISTLLKRCDAMERFTMLSKITHTGGTVNQKLLPAIFSETSARCIATLITGNQSLKTVTIGQVSRHADQRTWIYTGLTAFLRCLIREQRSELEICIRFVTCGSDLTVAGERMRRALVIIEVVEEEWRRRNWIDSLYLDILHLVAKLFAASPKLRIECYFTNYFIPPPLNINSNFHEDIISDEKLQWINERFVWKQMPLADIERMLEQEEQDLMSK